MLAAVRDGDVRTADSSVRGLKSADLFLDSRTISGSLVDESLQMRTDAEPVS